MLMTRLRKSTRGRSVTRAGGRPIVLFGIAHAGFFRNFAEVIRLLCAAGVDVYVRCSKEHDTIAPEDYHLDGHGPGAVRFLSADSHEAPRLLWAERIRLARDVLFYSGPQFEDAACLRERFPELQKEDAVSPRTQQRLHALAAVDAPRLKRAADTCLAWCDRGIRPDAEYERLLDDVQPDLVVVTPLVNFASREVDLVKAAQRRGVPTLLAVASWDNLTNKGIIKITPDHMAVWNGVMAREAVTLHRQPPDSIWITGAAPFDEWFERWPSRNRRTFFETLGLNPSRRLVVYVCSSRAIAGPDEHLIVKDWVRGIQESGDPRLADINVVVRPHPMELKGWHRKLPAPLPDVGRRYGAVIWPTTPKHPTTDATRADFFDTLYHADAIVGLNTSAMIEAAILGKPVLTFLDHASRASQTGNLHFRHLIDGGFVLQAASAEEHVHQLSNVLQQPQSMVAACERFVNEFVRPWGREVPASVRLAHRIAELVGLPERGGLPLAVQWACEGLTRRADQAAEEVTKIMKREIANAARQVEARVEALSAELQQHQRTSVDEAAAAVITALKADMKGLHTATIQALTAEIKEAHAATAQGVRALVKDAAGETIKSVKADMKDIQAANAAVIRAELKELRSAVREAALDDIQAEVKR